MKYLKMTMKEQNMLWWWGFCCSHDGCAGIK